MSEAPQEAPAPETAEVTQADVDAVDQQDLATHPDSEIAEDVPATPSKPFDVTGAVDATDQHDAYKQLQAHFLALSRGDAGTLDGVKVQVA